MSKDCIENRGKSPLGSKLRAASLILRENGVIWTTYLSLYYGMSAVAEWAHERMTDRRLRKGLPGLNSISLNREIWRTWDWEPSRLTVP